MDDKQREKLRDLVDFSNKLVNDSIILNTQATFLYENALKLFLDIEKERVLNNWKSSLIDGEFVSKVSVDILERQIQELFLTPSPLAEFEEDCHYTTVLLKDKVFQGVSNE